jgi:hypothetical protein
MPCLTFAHDHVIYRVVRTSWSNPLDASFSRVGDKRWNAPGTFPVLYSCCSESVARAITFDLYRTASIDLDDLTQAMRPELVEIQWAGDVVDMFSPAGITAAGFDGDYPVRATRAQTQTAGAGWHAEGQGGNRMPERLTGAGRIRRLGGPSSKQDRIGDPN